MNRNQFRKEYNKHRFDIFQVEVEVVKVALTLEQVQQYNLPPNPAKMSDPRANGYVAEHGNSSWELDALSPDVLVNLMTNAIEEYIDMDKYNLIIQLEEKEKKAFEDYADNFDVSEYDKSLNNNDGNDKQ